MNKRLLQTLKNKPVDKVPIWMMRQAGRHLPEYREIRKQTVDFMQMCLNPEWAVPVTLQPLKRYDIDAAIVFSDILVVPWGMGCSVVFHEGQGPEIQAPSIDALMRWDIEGFINRLNPVYDTIREAYKALSSTQTMIGFIGCPWTLACYILEGRSSKNYPKAFALALNQSDDFDALIQCLTHAVTIHAKQQILAGAEVIQCFDPLANILFANGFQKWCMTPLSQIAESIKLEFPNVPLVFFHLSRGNSIKSVVQQKNVDGVGIDSGFSPRWVQRYIQPHKVPQGNLDPQILVYGGDILQKETEEILNCLGKKPFVFNLGHGVLPETPISHVEQVIETVHMFKI